MASEEQEEPILGDEPNGKYVVAFDPLGMIRNFYRN
jgi:fructose-1,6-bisphosphatase